MSLNSIAVEYLQSQSRTPRQIFPGYAEAYAYFNLVVRGYDFGDADIRCVIISEITPGRRRCLLSILVIEGDRVSSIDM